MLQPKWWSTDANEIEKGHTQNKANQSRPDFEWKLHHLYVEQERHAVTHERDKDDEFPVGIDYAKSNDRQVNLRAY
jgi:hypothetical protein